VRPAYGGAASTEKTAQAVFTIRLLVIAYQCLYSFSQRPSIILLSTTSN
jgi:hypothetical protein